MIVNSLTSPQVVVALSSYFYGVIAESLIFPASFCILKVVT